MTASDQDEHADIRDAVAKLCAQFPGEYWRKLDREMAYPKAFVDALTESGYLSVLIPEEYGGAGLKLSAATAILEEIHKNGCNAGACHAQMYTMGTVLRHGSDAQKAQWLPKIASGELRLQAFGVTEPPSGTDTSSLKTFARREGNDSYIVNGQKIWTSRAEYSDLMILLARTTPKEQAKKRTDGLSVFIVDMREAKKAGLSIRPIRTMMNHSTTEVFFTDMKVPAENLIGEEGKGFRYILSGMNAERILVTSEVLGDGYWLVDRAGRYSSERRGVRIDPGHPVPDRPGLRPAGGGQPDAVAGGDRLRAGQAAGLRGQRGQAARFPGALGGGQRRHDRVRRLRRDRGVRHRAQVQGCPLPAHRPDQQQHDLVLHCHQGPRNAEVVLMATANAAAGPAGPAAVPSLTGVRILQLGGADSAAHLCGRLPGGARAEGTAADEGPDPGGGGRARAVGARPPLPGPAGPSAPAR